MRLHDLLGGLDVTGRRGALDVDIGSVAHDSRAVGPGALFACIPGAATDGHDHAPAAVAAGAVALLVERFLPIEVPQVRVPSVRVALGPVSDRVFGHPSAAMRVLGVTGTNGKTTTTYLLEQIARAAGDTTGVVGTVGARVGDETIPAARTTPEAPELQALLARMRDAGVQTVAMEVSSHALVQRRVDGTAFAAVCFTNLSHDHLDFHGSMEAYYDAKARLFDGSFARRVAVNADDTHGARLAVAAREHGLDVWTYSIAGAPATLRARAIELGADGSTFELESVPDGATRPVTTRLLGAFNLSNALAAAATARAAGIGLDAVVAGLAVPVVVPGRLERVDHGPGPLVLVDYAHTPDALAAALDAARGLQPGGRLLVVFGCGGDRDRAKRPLMGSVVAHAADAAWLTSDNPRSEDPAAIAADVLAGMPARAPVVELDRRAAIGAAVRAARPGDVVVIAGKGHEQGQESAGVTVPFDDRAVAREALEACSCT